MSELEEKLNEEIKAQACAIEARAALNADRSAVLGVVPAHNAPAAKKLIQIREVDNGYIIEVGHDYSTGLLGGYHDKINYVAKDALEATEIIKEKLTEEDK